MSIKNTLRYGLRVWGTTIVIVAVGFVAAYQFVKPAPPRNVTMAAGSPGGAAHQSATRFAAEMAKEGIKLTILDTNGSIENLRLLTEGKADLALVQAGTGSPESWPGLASLGCMYYEPLWVLLRTGLDADELSDMAGWTLAVGPEGSGTKVLSTDLLKDNGVMPDNTRFLSLPQAEAVKALASGDIDAMFWVTGTNSPLLGTLSSPPVPRLFSFKRWQAYVVRYDYLTRLVLPQGVLDLALDLPKRDVNLLASTAELVTGPDFHPALADLFLMAAETIHQQGGLMESSHEFPRVKGSAFHVTRQAKSFYKNGPPFLQRFMPFWVANFVNRMLVMLLPLLTLLYPLTKIAPPAYRWQVRRRIYRWYERLRKLEKRLETADTAGELRDISKEVEKLNHAVAHISVPTSFAHDQYQLRSHVALIRAEVKKRLEEKSQGA